MLLSVNDKRDERNDVAALRADCGCLLADEGVHEEVGDYYQVDQDEHHHVRFVLLDPDTRVLGSAESGRSGTTRKGGGTLMAGLSFTTFHHLSHLLDRDVADLTRIDRQPCHLSPALQVRHLEERHGGSEEGVEVRVVVNPGGPQGKLS